mgnify:FL=1|jgi:hypothetical protein|tara:strand:- start:299 stop:553 length:255 start_codon:yes stop_codon:yes gene_type:complete
MTKKELRELIRATIKEYTGTGASGGNSNGFNNITSPRIGGSFHTDEEEIEDYRDKNVGMGARGKQTSGMVPNFGNPNRTRFTKM